MDNLLAWTATLATITAASLTASNLGPRITGYGFIVFAIGSVAWIGVGFSDDQPALIWTNVALTFLNLFGIWRWLGRVAKFEEGSGAAADASRKTPGEALFPSSLLTHARVRSEGTVLGACIDAMVGKESGRVAYVMISDGGVAGAGETLRRLPWSEFRVADDEVESRLSEAQFRSLEAVARDEWPGQ